MKTSEATDKIYPALHKAKMQFAPAVKAKLNPHFKSNYVNLEGVLDAIEDALHTNDLMLLQPTNVSDGRAVLETMLVHAPSGQYIAGEYPVHPIKADPQAEGSALTYARRYAIMALVGIAPEDDDGNAATAAATAQNTKAKDKPLGVAGKPKAGMEVQDMPADRQPIIREIGDRILAMGKIGKMDEATEIWRTAYLDHEEKVALWGLIDSTTRSAITRLMRNQPEGVAA